LAVVGLSDKIATFAEWMRETYRRGGKVILFGNGGSACDAAHVAGELVGRFQRERRSLPAIALTDPAILSAIGNDYGFEAVFARQVEAWAAPGDLAVGISTSGKSPNVLAGLAAAKRKGARTVALAGAAGVQRSDIADLVLAVPSRVTPRVQECHMTIAHIVCELVERDLEE
jgi:D-sedoheptulose 7-phosphate isomerase